MGLVAGTGSVTECEVGLLQKALPGDVGRQCRGRPRTAKRPRLLGAAAKTAAVPDDSVVFRGLLC